MGKEQKRLQSKDQNIDQNYLFRINIQLFADEEKTEEPTSKRKQEAREKGQVAKSTELPQAITLVTGMFVLNIFFKYFYKVMDKYLISIFQSFEETGFSLEKLNRIWMDSAIAVISVTGPVLLSILVMGLVSNYLQVGFLFTLEPLKPSFEKIDPIKGLGKLFSLKKIVELIKTVMKLMIVGFYAYLTIKNSQVDIQKIIFGSVSQGFITIFSLAYEIAFKISLALFILALMDYFYQRWEHNKSLKMSKQEIKEEYKQTEGDPQLKSKRQAMQRELVKRKIIEEVPEATVVVTNPTHLAIALKYEKGMQAPLLLVKGADNIAKRIRELARENDIPLVENKPLARALYKNIEPGEEITEEYYKAVAEILKYVYES
ncbi:MAG: flagellar biosynthesis protein FlhB [Fusobacteriota bacterium]